jgi:hypothetical protein
LGLCANIPAAPLSVPTGPIESSDHIQIVSGIPAIDTLPPNLDFPLPLIIAGLLPDADAVPPDDSLGTLARNTALPAPEPSAFLLLPIGLALMGIAAMLRQINQLLESRQRARGRRRRVRYQIRMMA